VHEGEDFILLSKIGAERDNLDLRRAACVSADISALDSKADSERPMANVIT
jgi:hypothetical protein